MSPVTEQERPRRRASPSSSAVAQTEVGSGTAARDAAGEAVGSGSGLPPRFLRNVGATYVTSAAQLLMGLAIPALIIRSLGDQAFGVWSLAFSTVGYLGLLELGFGSATIKLVAEDVGRRDDRVLGTINTGFAVLCTFGAVAAVAATVLAVLAPAIFSVPPAMSTEAVLVFLALGTSAFLALPGNTFGAVIIAYQRWDLLAISNTGLFLLTLAFSAVVLLTGGSLVLLAVVTAAVSVAMHLVRVLMVRHLVPSFRISPRLVQRSRAREIAKLSGWFIVHDIGETLSLNIDLIVLGLFLDLRAVALFALGQKLAYAARKIIRPLSQVILPEASFRSGDVDGGRLSALYLDGTRASVAVGAPIAILLIGFSDTLIQAWVGPGFERAATVLVILAAALGLGAVTAVSWDLLLGAGGARVAAIASMAEAALNLGISLVLVRTMGLVGPAIGTLVGIVVVNMPLSFIYAGRVAGVTPAEVWRGALRPHLPAIGITILIVAIAHRMVPANLIAVGAAGAVTLVIYAASYLVLGANEHERAVVRARLPG